MIAWLTNNTQTRREDEESAAAPTDSLKTGYLWRSRSPTRSIETAVQFHSAFCDQTVSLFQSAVVGAQPCVYRF